MLTKIESVLPQALGSQILPQLNMDRKCTSKGNKEIPNIALPRVQVIIGIFSDVEARDDSANHDAELQQCQSFSSAILWASRERHECKPVENELFFLDGLTTRKGVCILVEPAVRPKCVGYGREFGGIAVQGVHVDGDNSVIRYIAVHVLVEINIIKSSND